MRGVQDRAHLSENYSGGHGRARSAEGTVRPGEGGARLLDLGEGETALGEAGVTEEASSEKSRLALL